MLEITRKQGVILSDCELDVRYAFRNHTWAYIGVAAVSAVGSIGSAMIGKKNAPATAQYNAVDPTAVQNNAIAGDISSFDSANQLAQQTTASTAEQALSARNITQPGYSNLANSLTGQATSLAQNPYQVPQGVVDQLSQYAAENNIGAGTGASSGFSQSNLLRSLGVNALQYGQSNLSLASQALGTLTGTAPNVSPVSPLSFMLTPQNALSAVTNNNTQQQAIAQGANNAATAASNANAATNANLFDSFVNQYGSGLLGAATGGATTPQGSGPSNGGYVSIGAFQDASTGSPVNG